VSVSVVIIASTNYTRFPEGVEALLRKMFGKVIGYTKVRRSRAAQSEHSSVMKILPQESYILRRSMSVFNSLTNSSISWKSRYTDANRT
jgi:hypothetical protein